MDRRQIEQWGEEADAYACTLYNSEVDAAEWHTARDERFAALVAAHEREAVIALLQGIDETDSDGMGWWETSTGADFGAGILAAIRERGAPNDKKPPTPEGAGGK